MSNYNQINKSTKMKHTFFKSIILLAAGSLIMLSTGCSKLETFDPEVDPNGASSPNPAGLLVSAETWAGNVIGSTGTGGVRAGLFAQYFSETQYTDASLYSEPKLEMSATFAGPLADLQKIINLNTDPATKDATAAFGSNGNQLGIAKILKAYYMWTITDRWGPVPFSEALQGGNNFTPKYEDQSDIYDGLLALLEEGAADFDNGAPMQGDIFYDGDADSWKKLANTLRMFIALRMSKVYPGSTEKAAVAFAAAASDPAFIIEGNDQNLTLPYPGGNYNHPWYDIYNGRTDYALSKTLFDIMDNMGDGRVAAFGTSGDAFPYGLERGDAVGFTAAVGGNYSLVLAEDFRQMTSDLVIVNAATSMLALAEGLQRGWVTTGDLASPYTDEEAYRAGIKMSYLQWGLSASDADLQITNTQTNYNTGTGGGINIGDDATYHAIVGASAQTTTKLQRIQLQRFIAHYPDGIQGWSEWRRTGVPNLKPTAYATNATENGQIPRRYVYATNEYSLNPNGVAGGLSDLTGSGDRMDSRMWWDQQ
jgi:hypothetical protein